MNEHSFFNLLDYVYIFIIVASTAFGFVKGFTRVFLSLVAWIGGGFLSIMISPHLHELIRKHFNDPNIARAVSGGLSYIIVMVVSLIVVGMVSDYIKQSVLSGLDRAAGTLFGLLRGASLPLCVCLMFLVLDIDKREFETLRNSKISDAMFEIVKIIAPSLEKNKIQDIRKKLQKTRNKNLMAINTNKKQLEETTKASTFKIINTKN